MCGKVDHFDWSLFWGQRLLGCWLYRLFLVIVLGWRIWDTNKTNTVDLQKQNRTETQSKPSLLKCHSFLKTSLITYHNLSQELNVFSTLNFQSNMNLYHQSVIIHFLTNSIHKCLLTHCWNYSRHFRKHTQCSKAAHSLSLGMDSNFTAIKHILIKSFDIISFILLLEYKDIQRKCSVLFHLYILLQHLKYDLYQVAI